MVSDGIVSLETGIVITAILLYSTQFSQECFVVYTDVVNGVLIILGTCSALAFLIIEVGGLDEVISVAESAGKWQLFGNWGDERRVYFRANYSNELFCSNNVVIVG